MKASFEQQERINQSLEFLLTIAERQRGHERTFLEQKIKEIENSGDGDFQDDLLKDLKDALSDESAFDYLKFINAINEAILNIERYKTRLKALKDTKNTADVHRNLINELQTSLNNYTERRTQFHLSQEELIRQLTNRFFQSGTGKEFLISQVGSEGALNFATAMLLIQTQLARYIYDNGILQHNRVMYKNDAEFLKELDRLTESLEDFSKQTDVQTILHNNKVLQEASKLFGITAQKEVVIRKTKAVQNTEKNIEQIRKKIGNPIAQKDKDFTNTLKKINVTWTGDKKISIAQEIMSVINGLGTTGVHMGGKNAATDIILGSFIIETPESSVEDPVAKELENLRFDIDDKKATNNIQKTAEIYLDHLDTLNKNLEGLGKGFIFHESTKFYQSIEKGTWFKNKSGFHGRNMNLFNFIDIISQFGMGFGIDTRWLKFAAYNLAESAMGSSLKAPLETYFSIAAGVAMFDDFSIVAKETSEEMIFSNIENIHLYNLNGIYFPASYFLQATYNAMISIKDKLVTIQTGDNMGFKATITTPGVSYTPPMSEEKWENVKGQAEGAKIDLAFAANFLSFVSQLF